MDFFIRHFFINIFLYWLLTENQRKSKLQLIFAGLGNGLHVLGNGPHVLGNGPHVLGNGLYLCTQFMNTGLFLLWGG